MTKRILPFALAACVVFAAAFFARPAATAMPFAATAGMEAKSAVDFVRHRRNRHKAVSRRANGVEVFIVPGLYWGPAWWDANYTHACWRQIQPCTNCARNWAYTC